MILAGLWMYTPTTLANDSGYVYEEINVYVEVNEEREYKVTEVMRIDFEEEMHGIVRDIPKSGSVEKVEIKDIQVEGMPFTVDDRQDRVDVKIGDANQLVKGTKEITLSYTLAHYQDYDHSYDYVYVNVLGADYDTQIKKFHAQITFPSPERLIDYNVTSGKYGETSNAYVKEQVEGNTISIDSTQSIPAKVGVTAQLRFQEGVFSQAPEYEFPYVIKENTMHIEVNEEQDFIVTQTIDYQAKSRVRMCFPTIAQGWGEGEYAIEVIQLPETHDVSIYEEHIYVYATGKEGSFTISYKVHPYRLMKDTIPLTLHQIGEDTIMKQFSMDIVAPHTIDGSVFLARTNDTTRDDRYLLAASQQMLHLETTDSVDSAEIFTFHFSVDRSYYHREQGSYAMLSLIICAVLLLLVGVLRFVIFKKPKLIVPIQFYPPDGMNSAEAGYIIDMKLSENDLTSLLFYWADQGYLKIHHVQGNYHFEKQKDVDTLAPAYEQKLFQDMFSHGQDGIVTREDLRYHFYDDIQEARKSIHNIYSGEHKLRLSSVEYVRKLFMGASGIPILYYLLANLFYTYGGGISIFGCILYVLLVAFAISLIMKSWKAPSGFAGKVMKGLYRGIACILLLVLLIASRVEITPIFCVCFISTILVLWLSNDIHKDTKYREEALIPLLGFKDFILHAEKERLETLLTQDPQYYYHVLPYAQVLHVSDIWINKFSDLLVAPPQWYMGEETFRYVTFASCVRSIERDMQVVCAPRTTHRGSSHSFDGNHYSGGGSGFSSGGSSGGGSGGGGSRGW